MGHNTCKSMGRVLCVVKRYVLNGSSTGQTGSEHLSRWPQR